MTKLIAFTAIEGKTVLINPAHIIKVHPSGNSGSMIVLSNYEPNNSQVVHVVQPIDKVEEMVNGVNDD